MTRLLFIAIRVRLSIRQTFACYVRFQRLLSRHYVKRYREIAAIAIPDESFPLLFFPPTRFSVYVSYLLPRLNLPIYSKKAN